MSKQDIRLFLGDILDAVGKVEKYIKGMSFEDFVQNDMAVDAVVQNLEIIGEASGHIPEDIRSKYPEIPWKRVVGFRNIVIHGYFDVDLEIVWTIATNRLQEVKHGIRRMLEELEG